MSDEYPRRGRNWLTAMGVLFLFVSTVTFVRYVIIWCRDFFLDLFFYFKKNSTTKSGLQIIISLTNVTVATTKNKTPIAVNQFLPRRVYSSLMTIFSICVF